MDVEKGKRITVEKGKKPVDKGKVKKVVTGKGRRHDSDSSSEETNSEDAQDRQQYMAEERLNLGMPIGAEVESMYEIFQQTGQLPVEAEDVSMYDVPIDQTEEREIVRKMQEGELIRDIDQQQEVETEFIAERIDVREPKGSPMQVPSPTRFPAEPSTIPTCSIRFNRTMNILSKLA